MTVRDLGYQPYEGKRLASGHNTWVMFRHGLGRVWSSWLVKLTAFLCWVPTVVALTVVGIRFYIEKKSPFQAEASAFDPADVIHTLYAWQLWLFVTLVTVGAGATVVAEDLTFRSFSFYFAKPVALWQYVVGRLSAVGLWCFLLTWVPGVLVTMAIVSTREGEERMEALSLLFPVSTYAAVIAVVMTVVSVGVSTLSASRALTRSVWLLVFIVPHVVAIIAETVSGAPWFDLASIPAMVGHIGRSLLWMDPEGPVRWHHAAVVLATLLSLSLGLTHYRLRNAEVIA